MATVFKKQGRGDWQIEYTDEFGQRRRQSSKTTDKRAAVAVATNIEAEVAKRLSGGLTAREKKIRVEDQRPFKDHVDDYVAHQKLHGRAERHVTAVKKCLLALSTELGVVRLSEVTRDGVESYLRKVQAKGIPLSKRKSEEGCTPQPVGASADDTAKTRPPAARTLNYARNSIASFMAWAVESWRARENPVAGIKRQSEANPTRKRRALTSEELQKLFQASEAVGRRPYYSAAYFAGLRRSELAKLTWGDVDLEAGHLTIRDGKAKGRVDVLPLDPRLCEQLVGIRPALPLPTARVFPTVPANKARKRDFEAAGIPTKPDDAGRIADLHSLRATLGTDLARQGVAPQVAQRLLRHSTINLTMKHYTKLRIDDLAGGLGRLVVEAPKQPAAAAAAGGAERDATGESPAQPSQWNRQCSQHEAAQTGAASRNEDAPDFDDGDDDKSPSGADLRDEELVGAAPRDGGRWRIRTSAGPRVRRVL